MDKSTFKVLEYIYDHGQKVYEQDMNSFMGFKEFVYQTLNDDRVSYLRENGYIDCDYCKSLPNQPYYLSTTIKGREFIEKRRFDTKWF